MQQIADCLEKLGMSEYGERFGHILLALGARARRADVGSCRHVCFSGPSHCPRVEIMRPPRTTAPEYLRRA
jgi:hypothetical protein